MLYEKIPGLGLIHPQFRNDFIDLVTGGNGLWRVGMDGVLRIVTPLDRKIELIIFEDKTLAYLKSALGYPAIYPLHEIAFEGPAQAVLMDLDGTSVRSEEFWIRMIEQTMAQLVKKPGFMLEDIDEPYISGHSVSEHLQYCIDKYCPWKVLEEARKIYFELTRYQMNQILAGRGPAHYFAPSPHLKEFLTTLKTNRIKIGLVTSGLYEKAWPEILAAFRVMGLGDPLDFYDAIISAGFCPRRGQVGTLGELTPKPHPWLYAETARVGLGLDWDSRNRIIGIEDSAAGIIAIRLAGFAGVGVTGGNIAAGGARPFMYQECQDLLEILPLILGNGP
jgi:beta-phosphoglucomutase-like phosphatase (HAD superfamily)